MKTSPSSSRSTTRPATPAWSSLATSIRSKPRKRVEYWFGDVKAGAPVEPLDRPPAELQSVVKETLTDRVQLPRLYLSWLTPALFAPGDAELDVLASVLTGGKNSRLYKRLVYDLQLAQNVSASQASAKLRIAVHHRRHRAAVVGSAGESARAHQDDRRRRTGEAPRNARRRRARSIASKYGIEAGFLSQMEVVAAKAEQLNAYYFATGNADYFAKDLARYQAIQPAAMQATVRQWLPAGKRLELSVVPAPAGKEIR